AAHPDAPFDLRLPAVAPLFLDPAEVTVCASGGRVGILVSDTPPVTLSGKGVAAEFRSDTRSARAVDTGHGHHLIDATGLRHAVPERADLAALGVGEPQSAPWSVIRLLPEGPPLSRQAASRASY
ncbi:type VII secretion protein EccB, partial [Corynebacterium nasicanis]